MDYSASIVAAANAAGIDPNLALAVASRESAMNPNAVSPKGAVGLFQLMPSSFPTTNIWDVQTNISTGVAYLAQLLRQFGGNTSLALAAYNAGPGTVAKYGGIPPYPETQKYVSDIMAGLPAGIPPVYTPPASTPTESAAIPLPWVDTSGGSDTGGDGTFNFTLGDTAGGGLDVTTVLLVAGAALVIGLAVS